MKKLKLSSLQMGAKELLTREQMKAVFGGSGDDGSGGNKSVYVCSCSSGSGGTSWQYTYQPTTEQIQTSATNAGCSASPTCIWQVCGNPGVTC
jgi:hypothetical protein